MHQMPRENIEAETATMLALPDCASVELYHSMCAIAEVRTHITINMCQYIIVCCQSLTAGGLTFMTTARWRGSTCQSLNNNRQSYLMQSHGIC